MKTFCCLAIPVLVMVLATGGLAAAQGGDAAAKELSLEKKELASLADSMKAVFDAITAGDPLAEAAAKEAFFKEVGAVSKAHGVDDFLKFPDQIHRVKELTIDTTSKDARLFATKAGQGLQEFTFTDATEGDREYGYFVSIPKEYGIDSDRRFPVLIYLHDKADSVEKRRMMKAVRDETRAVFSDDALLDKFIIIVPVGPADGKKNLLDPAVNWENLEPGRKSAFIAIRVLLEKTVFDRSKVYIMGLGRSGLSAIRFVTWYPSLFSGAVAVDAPIEPLLMENAGGLHFLYIATQKDGAKTAEPAAAWAKSFSGNGAPVVEMVQETSPAGRDARLAAEGLAALHGIADLPGRNTSPGELALKSISLEFSTNCWLQIQMMNNTASMKVGDEDVPFVNASVDRGSNTFDIKTNRVGRLRIFLSDKLVDMDREIKINVNGAPRWSGTKERNGHLMLKMLYENWAGDYEVYTNYIDIEDEGA